MLPLYQCWCTNTNQYPIWLNWLEVNPHNTHAIYFNIWMNMVNVNRSGHAEWHFQTTRCKVCFLYINVSTLTPIGTQHDHSWQKTHITQYIKVKHSRLRHMNLTRYTTLWHFQNCCCHLCLLITLMYPDLSLQALHAQVDPMCKVTLGWW